MEPWGSQTRHFTELTEWNPGDHRPDTLLNWLNGTLGITDLTLY